MQNFKIGITGHYFNSMAATAAPLNVSVNEFVDNIAAVSDGRAKVAIGIDYLEVGNRFAITVADWGRGMDASALINFFQFGSEHCRKEGKESVYGVGGLAAIIRISRNRYNWTVSSKASGAKEYNVVNAPFSVSMTLHTEPTAKGTELVGSELTKNWGEPNTVIYVETDETVVSTLLSRKGDACAPRNIHLPNGKVNMPKIRRALYEHLAFTYADYLRADKRTGLPAMSMLFKSMWSSEDHRSHDVFVAPMDAPYERVEHANIEVDIGNGHSVPVHVEAGMLSANRLQKAVRDEFKSQFYLTDGLETQGLTIVVGKRVIATAQMESVWGLAHHPAHNRYFGRIIVDDGMLPRGALNTVYNKSGVDTSDEGWQRIFEAVRGINKIHPSRFVADDFDDIKKRYINCLRAANPEAKMSTGVKYYDSCRLKADVVLEKQDGSVALFLFPKKKATVADVVTLRACWDGTVASGKQPTSAFLVCNEVADNVKGICEAWSKYSQLGGVENYRFFVTSIHTV